MSTEKKLDLTAQVLTLIYRKWVELRNARLPSNLFWDAINQTIGATLATQTSKQQAVDDICRVLSATTTRPLSELFQRAFPTPSFHVADIFRHMRELAPADTMTLRELRANCISGAGPVPTPEYILALLRQSKYGQLPRLPSSRLPECTVWYAEQYVNALLFEAQHASTDSSVAVAVAVAVNEQEPEPEDSNPYAEYVPFFGESEATRDSYPAVPTILTYLVLNVLSAGSVVPHDYLHYAEQTVRAPEVVFRSPMSFAFFGALRSLVFYFSLYYKEGAKAIGNVYIHNVPQAFHGLVRKIVAQVSRRDRDRDRSRVNRGRYRDRDE